MILAIDTSTAQAGVAVLDGGNLRGELMWTAAGNHSEMLTPAVQHLLSLEHVNIRALTGLAVASGPGSFSGLRVGISEAKGLAMALNIPLCGIGTLDVIAFQASALSADILALLPAGRGQVYAGRFEGGTDAFRRVGEYGLLSLQEAAAHAGSSLLVGEGASLIAEQMRKGGRHPVQEPVPWRLRRAGFLAELGRRALTAGVDERDVLEPLYLRPSAAEERRASLPGSVR